MIPPTDIPSGGLPEEDNILTEYAKDLANRQKQRISAEVIRLTNNIDQIAQDTPTSVIPEMVFTNYFLNFFFDIATGKGDVNEGLLLKWLELSNGWYKGVNVINNQGKVLFTVPPLYRTEVISHDHIKGVNFTTLGRAFESRSTRTPEEGINLLNYEFSKLPKFIKLYDDQETGLIWRDIFTRYGLLVNPDSPKQQQEEPKVPTRERRARAKLEDLGIIED